MDAALVFDGVGDGADRPAAEHLHRQVGPQPSDCGVDRGLGARRGIVEDHLDRPGKRATPCSFGDHAEDAFDVALVIAPVPTR